MKKLLLLLILSLFTLYPSLSQEWFPVGAKWHYGWYSWIGGPSIYNYYYSFEVVKDTFFLNKNCKKIRGFKSLQSNQYLYSYRYDSAGKVFYAYPNSSNWNLLYDFNVTKGDTVYYPQFQTGDSINPIYYNVIDTVYYVIINNDTLKRYESYTNAFFDLGLCCDGFAMWETEIISGGEIIWSGDYSGDYPLGLRCYSDSIIGFYKSPGFNLNCDTAFIQTTSLDQNRNSGFKLFPNPSSGQINIQISDISFKNLQFKIFDLQGNLQKEIGITEESSTLDVSDLLPGMYIYQIESEGEFYRDKLLIE